MAKIKKYAIIWFVLFPKYKLKNILIGLDIFINSILSGSPYETISSRAWGWNKKGLVWPHMFIDWITYDGHCEDSYIINPPEESAMLRAKAEYVEKYQEK